MKTRAAFPPRQRADVLLVERGLFESRAKAQAAIAAGLVTADAVPVRKASEAVAIDAALVAEPAFPWVSRGGVKLDGALARFRGAGAVRDGDAETGGCAIKLDPAPRYPRKSRFGCDRRIDRPRLGRPGHRHGVRRPRAGRDA